jgi:hypothetical protein
MLIESIVQAIISDPGVKAWIGTPTSRKDKFTGVFLQVAPSIVNAPYIVISQIHGTPVKSMAGTNAMQFAGYQFTCWAGSGLTAVKTIRALKLLLDGLLGEYTNNGSPVVMTPILSCFMTSERDVFDEDLHATLNGHAVDYDFSYVDAG